jgi:lauroyl/myristoyl acyltransferase
MLGVCQAVITKTSLSKRRICLVQLEQSLRLLDEGDPVSALTLAGAVEEILGRIAERKGHEPRVVFEADYLASMADYVRKSRPARKQVIAALNRPRNHLKHQDDGRNIRIAADWQFEAESMLLRCMFNHFDAFGCYPTSKALRGWFESMTL